MSGGLLFFPAALLWCRRAATSVLADHTRLARTTVGESEVIVNLIANTTTKAGLRIRAELDRGKYPIGIKITDAELASLNLKPDTFHGDWNYAILPRRKKAWSCYFCATFVSRAMGETSATKSVARLK